MYKKILLLCMCLALIFPFLMAPNNKASANPVVRSVIKGVGAETAFYAISEKSGMVFAGDKGGADNFFDALRQSNYELYKNSENLKKDDKDITTRYEEVKQEFEQKPKKVRPGVGKIILSNVAFMVGYDVLVNSYNKFMTGYQTKKNIQIIEEIGRNSDGSAYEEIPGLFKLNRTVSDQVTYTVTFGTSNRTDWVGGYFTPGSDSGYVTRSKEATLDRKNGYYYYSLTAIATGRYYQTGAPEVYQKSFMQVEKDFFDNYQGEAVKQIAPKSLGTLNSPSWITGNETDLPGFIELEVPITEEGNPDPERQLSPDNPAVNDPTKAPKPPAPDYTVPDKEESIPGNEDTNDPSKTPILTPKPSPNTNPLPQPVAPIAPPTTPTEPTAPPAEEDPPTTKPDDTQNRWGTLVSTKFPFSLPWDIGNMISPLMADPKRPSVKVDKEFEVFGTVVPIKFSHNFAWMDDYIIFFRTFILIGFNIFLITGTRKLMGGGQ